MCDIRGDYYRLGVSSECCWSLSDNGILYSSDRGAKIKIFLETKEQDRAEHCEHRARVHGISLE
jgi:hypothetical protein